MLIITSHHRSETSTNSIGFHHSQVITRRLPAPIQHELSSPRHGTKVTVTDLFGNLPVRVKHRALLHQRRRDLDKEWDELRYRLTALLLAWHRPVNVRLTDISSSSSSSFSKSSRKISIRPSGRQAGNSSTSSSGSRDGVEPSSAVERPLCGSSYIDTNFVVTLLSQAGYVPSANADSWVSVSGRTSRISMRALICLEPSPTKLVQFISFGIRPLLAKNEDNALYQEVNRLFSLSSFGSADLEGRDDNLDSSDGKRQLAKGINRWPMFFCRIDLGDSDETQNIIDDDDDANGIDGHRNGDGASNQSTLQSVLEVLEALFVQFLRHYHFLPASQGKRQDRPETRLPETSRKLQSRTRSLTPAHNVSQEESHAHQDKKTPGEFDVRIPELGKMCELPRPSTSADFSSWTRVKSGHKYGASEDMRGRTIKQKNDSQLNYPTSTNASLGDPLFHHRPASEPAATRRTLRTTWSFDNTDHDERSAGLGDAGDEIIQWTDPVRKTVVLINSRTGQTISSNSRNFAHVHTKQRPSSAPTSSCSHCSHNKNIAGSQTKPPTPWLDDILQNWQNPVFQQPEKPLLSVAPSDPTGVFDSGPFSIVRALDGAPWSLSPATNSKLTKRQLQNAQFIAQVDNKFLLVRIWVTPGDSDSDSNGEAKRAPGKSKSLLVLVDQHAADERCRVENLFEELCASTSPGYATQLPKPISFQVPVTEAQLFRRSRGYFASWGGEYEVVEDGSTCSVIIKALPALIAERCRQEPRLAINMLRGEIWSRVDQGQDPSSFQRRRPWVMTRQHVTRSEDEKSKARYRGRRQDQNADQGSEFTALADTAPYTYTWPRLISQCPKGIIDMLNSRACRSAIMFNDVLDHHECEDLLVRLARCSFPFQCAHGRPSLVPIVSLGGAGDDDNSSRSSSLLDEQRDDNGINSSGDDSTNILINSGIGDISNSIHPHDALRVARDEYDEQKTGFFDAYRRWLHI